MSNLRNDKFMGTLAFAVSALVSYEVFSVCPNGDLPRQITGATVTFLTMLVTLYPALAFVVDTFKVSVRLRISCGIFFLAFVLIDFCYAAFGIEIPHFIFISGMLACIHAGVAYKLLSFTDV